MSSSTRFIFTNGKVTAQSYHPCHLFGDGDFYGKGVRYSFYLQYGWAIIALWFNLKDYISSARFGLTVLSGALFMNLCINSTGDGVVVLNWTIVVQLILFLPSYAMWRPLFSVFIWLRAEWFLYMLAVTKVEGRVLGRQEAKTLTESYGGMISALHHLAATTRYDREYIEAGHEYRIAVDNFLRIVSPDNQTPPPRVHAFRAGHLEAGMDSRKALREIYIDALVHIYTQHGYGQDTDHRQGLADSAETQVVKLAVLQSHEHAMKQIEEDHRAVWQQEITSFVVIILIWVAFICATPWLYFEGTNRGRKEGCDIKLRTLFAPISVYKRSYLIWLRFSACFGVAVLAPAGICAAVYLLYHGIESRNQDSQLRNDAENESVRTIPEPTKQQVKQSSKTDWENVERLRKYFYRWLGVPLCTIVLIITAVLVELTIKTNNIDLSSSAISSTSQLLPLLIACFTILPVLLHGAGELLMGAKRAEERLQSFMNQVLGSLRSRIRPGNRTEVPGEDRRAEEGIARPQNTRRYV